MKLKKEIVLNLKLIPLLTEYLINFVSSQEPSKSTANGLLLRKQIGLEESSHFYCS